MDPRIQRQSNKDAKLQRLNQMMSMFSPEQGMRQALISQELQNGQRGSQSNLNNSLVGLLNTAAAQGNIVPLLNEILGQQGYQSRVEPMQGGFGMPNPFGPGAPTVSPKTIENARKIEEEYLNPSRKRKPQMQQQEVE